MMNEQEFYRVMSMIKRLTEKGKEQTPAYARLIDRAFEIAPPDVENQWIERAIELGYLEADNFHAVH